MFRKGFRIITIFIISVFFLNTVAHGAGLSGDTNLRNSLLGSSYSGRDRMEELLGFTEEELIPDPDIINENPKAFSYTDSSMGFSGVDMDHLIYAQSILAEKLLSKERFNRVLFYLNIPGPATEENSYKKIYEEAINQGYTKELVDLINGDTYTKLTGEQSLEETIVSQNIDPKTQSIYEAISNSLDALGFNIGLFGKGIKQILDWLEPTGEDTIDVFTKEDGKAPYRITILRAKDGIKYVQIKKIGINEFYKASGNMDKGTAVLINFKKPLSYENRQDIVKAIHRKFPIIVKVKLTTQIGKEAPVRVNGFKSKEFIVGEPPSAEETKDGLVQVILNENTVAIIDNGKGMDSERASRMFLPKGGEKHEEPLNREIDKEKLKLVHDPLLPRSISFARNEEVLETIEIPSEIQAEAVSQGDLIVELGRFVDVGEGRDSIKILTNLKPGSVTDFQFAVEHIISRVISHTGLSDPDKVKYVNTIVVGLDGVVKVNSDYNHVIKTLRADIQKLLNNTLEKLTQDGYIILPHDKKFSKLALSKNEKVIFLHEGLFKWRGAISLAEADKDAAIVPGVKLGKDGKLLLAVAPFTDESLKGVVKFDRSWHAWKEADRVPIIKTNGCIIIPSQLGIKLQELAVKRVKEGLTESENQEFSLFIQLVNILTGNPASSYELEKVEPTIAVSPSFNFKESIGKIDSEAINGFLKKPPGFSGALRELTGHAGSIYSAVFSPDNKKIVTASKDNKAIIWDAETGKKLHELTGYTEDVLSAKFSNDGKKIVTASKDNKAIIWDAETGKKICELTGHAKTVWSAVFSNDDKRVVTASGDNKVIIWDAETGKAIRELIGHTDNVWSAVFSPDGTKIVTASEDKKAIIWDAETGKKIYELIGHVSGILSAVFSPDGKKIVTAGYDKKIIIWHAETGKKICELIGHTHNVWSAAFSPDSRKIVTASKNDKAIIWDAETGKNLHELAGHTNWVNSAVFSPDGKKIVTASRDNKAIIWDAETGNEIYELAGHTNSISLAVFSSDGKKIVTASDDNKAIIWDISGIVDLPKELTGHTNIVRSAVFSPDGKKIVTASKDNKVIIWDAETGNNFHELTGHTDIVRSAVFSPDGKKIVTASNDKKAIVWDAKTGNKLYELIGHAGSVNSAVFSPDGKKIVTASNDNKAIIWDAETGKKIYELIGHTGFVYSVVFSPDGTKIVTVGADKKAIIWDAETGKNLHELIGHTGVIYSAVFSSDNKKIVTASSDNKAIIWESETGKNLHELIGHTGSVWSAVFSHDGKKIVTASSDNKAIIWDVPETVDKLNELIGHTSSVYSAAFSSDNKKIVTASKNNKVIIWNAETGKNLHELTGHTDIVWSAVFSPDNKKIVTASYDKKAIIWEVKTGKKIHELIGHTGSVRSAVFSPDGTKIVTASEDKKAIIWEVKTGKKIHELIGHTGVIYSVVFSPDGKKVITASEDKKAIIWDAETGNKLYELIGHNNDIRSAKFSPDGKKIVTASEDKKAIVWDVETGNKLYELIGHTSWIYSAVFSPDGKKIVTASRDKKAIVWDAETGDNIYELTGHADSVNSAIFSPDNKKIVTVSDDNKAIIWSIPNGKDKIETIDPEVMKLWSDNVLPKRDSLIALAQEAYELFLEIIPEEAVKPALKEKITQLYKEQEKEINLIFNNALLNNQEINLTSKKLLFEEFKDNMRHLTALLSAHLESVMPILMQEEYDFQIAYYTDLFANIFELALQRGINISSLNSSDMEIPGYGWEINSREQFDAIALLSRFTANLRESSVPMIEPGKLSMIIKALSYFVSKNPSGNMPIAAGQLEKILSAKPEVRGKFLNELCGALNNLNLEDAINCIDNPAASGRFGTASQFFIFLTHESDMVRYETPEESEHFIPEGRDIALPKDGISLSQIRKLEKKRIKNKSTGGNLVMSMDYLINNLNNLPERSEQMERDIIRDITVQRDSGSYTAEIAQNSKDATKGTKGELVVDFYIHLNKETGLSEYVEEARDNGPGADFEAAFLTNVSTKHGANQKGLIGRNGTGKYTSLEGVDRLEIITKNKDRAYLFGFTVIKDSRGRITAVRLSRIRELYDIELPPTTVIIRRIKTVDNTIPGLDCMLAKMSYKNNTGLSQDDNFSIFFVDYEHKKQKLIVEYNVLSRAEFNAREYGNIGMFETIATKDMPSQVVSKAGFSVCEIKEEYLKLVPHSLRKFINELGVNFKIPLDLIRGRGGFKHEKERLSEIQKYVAIELYKAIAYKTLTQTKPQFVFENFPLDWETNDSYWDSIGLKDKSAIDIAEKINTFRYSEISEAMLKGFLTNPDELDLKKKFVKIILLLEVALDPAKPDERTSLFLRRCAVQKQNQEALLKEQGFTVGNIPDLFSVPNFMAKIHKAESIKIGHEQMRNVEEYVIDPGVYSEKEKALVNLAFSAAEIFGLERVYLINNEARFAGAFGSYEGKKTMFLNQSFALNIGEPDYNLGITDKAVDTINHEFGHFMEKLITEGDSSLFEDIPGKWFIAHSIDFTHDQEGVFASARKYGAALWLFNLTSLYKKKADIESIERHKDLGSNL